MFGLHTGVWQFDFIRIFLKKILKIIIKGIDNIIIILYNSYNKRKINNKGGGKYEKI